MSSGVVDPAHEKLRKDMFHWMDMCMEARREAAQWKKSFKTMNKMHNELRDKQAKEKK